MKIEWTISADDPNLGTRPCLRRIDAELATFHPYGARWVVRVYGTDHGGDPIRGEYEFPYLDANYNEAMTLVGVAWERLLKTTGECSCCGRRLTAPCDGARLLKKRRHL